MAFVAVAIGAAVFISSYYQNLGQIPQVSSSLDASKVQPTTTAATVKSGTANQAQTYTRLVTEYKDRRIQFDMRCQAVPSNITYKNGTQVMFDNRSGDARVITIGGVKYNFPGYGYKIITLSSQTLPKNILLSCGAAVNVGQVLLQK